MLPTNPRELQKQLKQLKKLGIKIDQLENVEEAAIILNDKKLVLEKPDTFVVEFGGQKMFYLIAQNIREEHKEKNQKLMSESSQKIEVSDDDIRFVAEYTGVSIDKARETIERTGGDIAKAIELIEIEKKSKST